MKHILRKLIATAALFATAMPWAEAEPDPNFHIYLCWGQSNMTGAVGVPEEDLEIQDDRFQLLYAGDDCPICGRKKGEWINAVPPLSLCYHPTSILGYGPISSFGQTLLAQQDSSIRIGVSVVAIPGVGIEAFMKETCKDLIANGPEWIQEGTRCYGYDPYGRLIEMGKKAQEVGVIKGIIVHQGEGNCSQPSWPSRLNNVYNDMLQDLELKAEDVPLLVGEVRYDGIFAAHNIVLRTVPAVIPTAHLVSSEGCEPNTDMAHFSYEGYKLLGQRYANTILKLQNPDSTATSNEITLNTTITDNTEFGEACETTINAHNTGNNIGWTSIYIDFQLEADEDTLLITEDLTEGKHTVYAIAYDSTTKEFSHTLQDITIAMKQHPFNAVAAAIPGKIEAEHFDFGGEGIAFHDNDTVNLCDGLRKEGVDMTDSTVCHTEAGEWLEYTVFVSESGSYELTAYVLGDTDSASFKLYMGKDAITDTLFAPRADSVPTFTAVKQNVDLEQGKHVLKLEITGSGVYIDYLNFVLNDIEIDVHSNNAVALVGADNVYITDGEYAVYDVIGSYLGTVKVENGNTGLKRGIYMLKNTSSNQYKKVMVTE